MFKNMLRKKVYAYEIGEGDKGIIVARSMKDAVRLFHEMNRTDWIIAIANSDCDGVTIRRFFGTEDEVKNLFVCLVKEDKENDEDGYNNGTESVDEIVSAGIERFDAYATYSDYHIDYSAEAFSNLCFYDEGGKTYSAKQPN